MGLTDKELRRISETISMIPQDVASMLEVGCGDGRVSRRVDWKVKLIGLDIAWGKISDYPNKKIIGDIAKLPIKPNSFDMVLACEVLEHLPERTLFSVLQEMVRVTKRYILFTVPFKETLSAQWCRCSKCSYIYHVWGHLRTFDLNTLKSFFANDHLIEMRFLGPKEPRIPSIFYMIVRWLGNVWESDEKNPTLCPRCGSLPINRRGNIFGKLFIRFIWRVERILPFKSAVWIGCLYQTEDKMR